MADTQFREASWEMSKSDVRASEKSEPKYESDNSLGFVGKLLDADCMIYYEFDDHGLARAAYMIDHVDDGKDIVDYNRLKALLSTKYGPPIVDEMKLTPNLYRLPRIQQAIELQTAVAQGALHLKTGWQTADTSIGLACRGVKGNAQVAVMYNSLEAMAREARPHDTQELKIL